MGKLLGKWLNIYPDEIGLFLWSASLFFLIHVSDVLLNNFSETAFLKRYGVEYLPIMYMVNAISTFLIMGVLTGILTRVPGSRLLVYLLSSSGAMIAGIRFLIPLGIDLIYPVLFVLKSQLEVLLGLLFWDMANDLFNTRQSKRLFPLITAGGVLGGIVGSFATPMLAKAIHVDNLMLVYFGANVMGAVVLKAMGSRFPTLLLAEGTGTTKKKGSGLAMKEEIQKIIPLIRESLLVKILILLTLVPNMVIPIMNYQFNFAVDQAYATEGGMIKFFGYFRGSLNGISLFLLLFVGKVYGRWGLPVALMFHPFNYVLAFAAFLLRFDVVSAIYARISTTVLRTTINNPARAVLMGLFPPSQRTLVRPFLRGTVVRVAILMGSGFILLSGDLFHPRYLSVVAILFVASWIASTFTLKRKYSSILLDLISRDTIDLKSMEEVDLSQVFRDKKGRTELVQTFLSSKGEDALWFARILKSIDPEGVEGHLCSALQMQDDRTRIALLTEISSEASDRVLPTLKSLAASASPELMTAISKTASRLRTPGVRAFQEEILGKTDQPEVKAFAVAGLYRGAPETYERMILDWLASEAPAERRAGVMAAGESGDLRFLDKLRMIRETEADGTVLPHLIRAIHSLGAPDMKALMTPFLSHPVESVRLNALDAYRIEDDLSMKQVVALMNDPSDRVHSLAKEKLQDSSYQSPQVLIESLALPRRRVREGIYEVLASLRIRDLDVYRFARGQLEKAYVNLAKAERVRTLYEGAQKDLLIEHLHQRKNIQLDAVLRVLATQDTSGKMRTIWRGLNSRDSRRRSNSLEALEDLLDSSLVKILVPILEDLQSSHSLAAGKRHFKLMDLNAGKTELCNRLLSEEDWVSVVLTLNLIAAQGTNGLDQSRIRELAATGNAQVRQMARWTLGRVGDDAERKEQSMAGDEITIPEKILHLRGIQIFEGLSVGELAAIASVTEEIVFPPGETVIREGEPGDTMYLVIKGEVSVLKGQQGDGGTKEIELDRIRAGDYFGEMALVEDVVRSATVRTSQESTLLVLDKQEFAEIVKEYPQIALHICKVLSQRIRKLHEKIQIYERIHEGAQGGDKVTR